MKLVLRSAPLFLTASLAAQYTLHTDVPVNVPQTGNQELFNLALPDPVPANMPLIVVFHGLLPDNHHAVVDVSQDTTNNWDLLTDATSAGYGVLMPRAGHPSDYPGSSTIVTYGRRIMHWHVEAAIAQARVMAPEIDISRVYGYGFSMGGADALSYAARHLDPRDVMFAAVLTHSGAVSPPYIYHESSSTQTVFQGLYGAPPYATDPLPYQEAAVADYGGLVPAKRPDTSMGWNLTHVPLRSYWDDDGGPADDDAIAIGQNELLEELMNLDIGHLDFATGNTTGHGHGYRILDVATILAPFTSAVSIPTRGHTLVAPPLNGTRERMFHFNVLRRSPTGGAMARFTWDTNMLPGGVQPYPPLLTLGDVEGLAEIRGITRKLGYSPSNRLNIYVTIADAGRLVVAMTGYAGFTGTIYGNGVLLTQGVDWILNGSILEITLAQDTRLEIFP